MRATTWRGDFVRVTGQARIRRGGSNGVDCGMGGEIILQAEETKSLCEGLGLGRN